MSNNIYQATKNLPYHLSVGCVLYNNEKKIACHHFDSHVLQVLLDNCVPEKVQQSGLYVLMRETVENKETLIETVHRGLLEEFGAIAEIKGLLGSKEYYWTSKKGGHVMNKTTVYFLAECLSIDFKKRLAHDIESESVIEWHYPRELIQLMDVQSTAFVQRNDFDERSIVERAHTYLKNL